MSDGASSHVHPSDALLARFEHDRVSCELVPSASARGTQSGISFPMSLAIAVILPIVLALGFGLAVEIEAGLLAGFLGGAVGLIGPLVTYLSQRRIDVDLTPHALEIRWRVGQTATGKQAMSLASIRSVYAVAPTGQTPQMLRIVSHEAEVWLPAGGVPATSLDWLADEIMRAATTARDRDASGPPLELEALLSDTTRAARARWLKHEQARKQRA